MVEPILENKFWVTQCQNAKKKVQKVINEKLELTLSAPLIFSGYAALTNYSVACMFSDIGLANQHFCQY